LLAETVGTGLLVTVVVGSGIAAQQLSPDTAVATRPSTVPAIQETR